MGKLTYSTLICLLLLSFSGHAALQDDEHCFDTMPKYSAEQELATGKLRLETFLGDMPLGTPYMTLGLANNKIVDLNVGVTILGLKKRNCPTTLENLMNGTGTPINLVDDGKPIINIKPLPGFTADGGELDLVITTIDETFTERIIIAKTDGKFKGYRDSINDGNELVELSVVLKGSVNDLYNMKVSNYIINTVDTSGKKKKRKARK